jgi:hypothetical protein
LMHLSVYLSCPPFVCVEYIGTVWSLHTTLVQISWEVWISIRKQVSGETTIGFAETGFSFRIEPLLFTFDYWPSQLTTLAWNCTSLFVLKFTHLLWMVSALLVFPI